MRLIKIIIMLVMAAAFMADAKETPVNIWEGTGCHKNVKLTPFLVEGKDNPVVIVCPGGSYFWHDKATEGYGVARWLNSQGISAFVLEYRVGTVPGFIFHTRLSQRGNRYPDMLEDVQRSIQLVRENAAGYGIDPGRLGVMGFSAGGHLSAMSGIYFDTDVLGKYGLNPSVSLKPDFVAPIYPVVTMTAPYTHKRSLRGALGERRSQTPTLKDSLSLERHVRADMPPVFLMNCVDDPVVDFRNSILLDSALTAKKVPHLYVKYLTGGHGFGADPKKTTAEAIQWKETFINWLMEQNIIMK